MESFLQTTEWLKFQESAGHKVWRFPSAGSGQVDSGSIKANIIKYNLPLGKSYLYIPHGPEISLEHISSGLKNELANFIKYLKDLAKEEKSIFIKIEPLADTVIELMYRRGFKRSSKQIQPYKTVIVDLTLSEEHLLGKMHPKTRYNIKIAEKHGVQIKHSEDIDEFWKLMEKTTKRDGFSSHKKDYYEKLLKLSDANGKLRTELVLAYYNNKPIAGAIVLKYGDIGYYLHGASDHESRSIMAPYALHWEIMKELKNKEAKFYDFWGVDSKKWPGVTRFKMGWGGELREHPGSFDLVTSRLWYLGYILAKKII